MVSQLRWWSLVLYSARSHGSRLFRSRFSRTCLRRHLLGGNGQRTQRKIIYSDKNGAYLRDIEKISYKKGIVILACGDPALDWKRLTAGSPLREDDDFPLKYAPFITTPNTYTSGKFNFHFSCIISIIFFVPSDA